MNESPESCVAGMDTESAEPKFTLADTILIPKRLCEGVEVGQVVQYGRVACLIIGATVDFAVAGKITLKPGMDVKRIDNPDEPTTLGPPLKTREEILGDMPKGFIQMYGPLIVSLVRSNEGRARVMVWNYVPVERLTQEFSTIEQAQAEADRKLYVFEKHGVKAIVFDPRVTPAWDKPFSSKMANDVTRPSVSQV